MYRGHWKDGVRHGSVSITYNKRQYESRIYDMYVSTLKQFYCSRGRYSILMVTDLKDTLHWVRLRGKGN